MSASNENQNPQNLSGAGWADPKTAREAQQRKSEKRSNLLYGVIGVAFLVVAIAAIVWRSNIIPRTATAVTIGDEKYNTAEVTFFYQNVYQTFLNNNSYLISYLGLNTNASLKSQKIDESTASMMGIDAGLTWHDYFLDQALKQMALLQAALDSAKEEGYVYPDSIQSQYEDSVASLQAAAKASGLSVNKYLQSKLGAVMTEKVYDAQLLRMLQYGAYSGAYQDTLSYTDAQLNEVYAKDPNSYDLASYEVITVNGAATGTTDADGKTVEPTEEETAAAKAAAKTAADEMLSAYKSGKSLSTLADGNDNATYTLKEGGAYMGDTVTEWLFDSARKAGDSAVLESGSNYVVTVFHNRYREEYNTVDIRHILCPLGTATKSEGDEGYEEEQAQLKADAKAKAEELLSQWQSGEATEDSFATLATETSSDGSKYDGGLYKEVYQNQMVDTFNDWCFDTARKSGDTGIVETTYGAHVMYFVGTDMPRWQSQAASTLKNDDFANWIQEFSKKYTAEQHSFGMKFVG
ncbi:peptidylprolyl isomerase [Oscillibacter sp.]|uniref:peptidylprolyl isomerase n=1 Tax=Oscillibacter sp. TaxID=1945593 RepID=UPI00260BE21A|nr:peptidylprolyl isomerase [Oscillibacter sp.]MDD3346867.1 peptidylprolyl isomerase [Oscillibacter sp.]